MPWTIIALVVVFVYVGLRDERPEPAEPVIVKGVRIEGLEIGPRDGHRRSRVLMTITNTTDKDIPGMQVAFVAGDNRGKMGPF